MASAQESRGRVERAFARAQTFSGWGDFGINVRTLGPDLPWNYDSLARSAVRNARSTLDLATGGGERFLGIIQGQPGRYTATEAWPVNVPVAATRLGPEGVAVVRCASSGGEPLPFRDAAFDLILNRHGGINAAEISRVLQRGGRLMVQETTSPTTVTKGYPVPGISDGGQSACRSRQSPYFGGLVLPSSEAGWPFGYTSAWRKPRPSMTESKTTLSLAAFRLAMNKAVETSPQDPPRASQTCS